MNKKTVKAMCNLNDVLDERYEKLSDKYHELELSHNRKKTALRRLEKMFWAVWSAIEDSGECWRWNSPAVEYVISICHEALFCDGRRNCRPIVQRKRKGGAK